MPRGKAQFRVSRFLQDLQTIIHWLLGSYTKIYYQTLNGYVEREKAYPGTITTITLN